MPPYWRRVGNPVEAAGEELVAVGLVAHVPDDAVAGRLELRVEGDRELHGPQARPEVAAGLRHRVDDRLAHLARERLELRVAHPVQVGRRVEAGEERVTTVGHGHGASLCQRGVRTPAFRAGAGGHYDPCSMPGLVLYDNPTSSNALKVRFLLAELGPPVRAPHGPAQPPAPGRVPRPEPGGRGPRARGRRLRPGRVAGDPAVSRGPRGAGRPLPRRPPRAGPRGRVPGPLRDRLPARLLPPRARWPSGTRPGRGAGTRCRATPRAPPASRARSGRRSRCWTPWWSPPARCSGGSRSPTAPWRRCCTARPRPAWT